MDRDEGQGLMEYVLLIALIAVVVIAVLTLFGLDVRNYYNSRVIQNL